MKVVKEQVAETDAGVIYKDDTFRITKMMMGTRLLVQTPKAIVVIEVDRVQVREYDTREKTTIELV